MSGTAPTASTQGWRAGGRLLHPNPAPRKEIDDHAPFGCDFDGTIPDYFWMLELAGRQPHDPDSRLKPHRARLGGETSRCRAASCYRLRPTYFGESSAYA